MCTAAKNLHVLVWLAFFPVDSWPTKHYASSSAWERVSLAGFVGKTQCLWLNIPRGQLSVVPKPQRWVRWSDGMNRWGGVLWIIGQGKATPVKCPHVRAAAVAQAGSEREPREHWGPCKLCASNVLCVGGENVIAFWYKAVLWQNKVCFSLMAFLGFFNCCGDSLRCTMCMVC